MKKLLLLIPAILLNIASYAECPYYRQVWQSATFAVCSDVDLKGIENGAGMYIANFTNDNHCRLTLVTDNTGNSMQQVVDAGANKFIGYGYTVSSTNTNVAVVKKAVADNDPSSTLCACLIGLENPFDGKKYLFTYSYTGDVLDMTNRSYDFIKSIRALGNEFPSDTVMVNTFSYNTFSFPETGLTFKAPESMGADTVDGSVLTFNHSDIQILVIRTFSNGDSLAGVAKDFLTNGYEQSIYASKKIKWKGKNACEIKGFDIEGGYIFNWIERVVKDPENAEKDYVVKIIYQANTADTPLWIGRIEGILSSFSFGYK